MKCDFLVSSLCFRICNLCRCAEETMTAEEISDAENELRVLGIVGNHPNVTTLVEHYKTAVGL